MGSFLERARTRIPSIGHFLRRARSDWRTVPYDLLPIASTPRARDQLAGAVALLKPRTRGFAPSDAARRLYAALATDGLSEALPPLPPDILADLRSHFGTIPCRDPYRAHLGPFRYDAPPSPETNMGYFSAEQIVAAPHVLRLFNDPLVLEAAELYLGCKPTLDNIGGWWSYGGRAAAKGTQRYHRDLDSLRGIKLFIYLTDVDATAGPHVYVKGTHRSQILDTGKAQTDEAIRATFGDAAEVAVTGAAGKRFVADTFGFHKGLLPTEGRRLMLTAQYTVNRTPHLPRRPFVETPEAGLDPYVNRLILRARR